MEKCHSFWHIIQHLIRKYLVNTTSLSYTYVKVYYKVECPLPGPLFIRWIIRHTCFKPENVLILSYQPPLARGVPSSPNFPQPLPTPANIPMTPFRATLLSPRWLAVVNKRRSIYLNFIQINKMYLKVRK